MTTVGILMFDDVEIGTFADAAALFSATDDSVGSPPLFRTLLLARLCAASLATADFSSNLRQRFEIILLWTFCLYRADGDAAGIGPSPESSN